MDVFVWSCAQQTGGSKAENLWEVVLWMPWLFGNARYYDWEVSKAALSVTNLPIPDRPVAQQPKANAALDEGLLIGDENLQALLLAGLQG